MKILLVLPALFTFLSTFASGAPGGQFHGGIEALYWMPIQTPISVGRRTVLSPRNPGERQDLLLNPDPEMGVQGFFGYCWDCHGVDATYTYYSVDQKHTYDRDGFPTMRIPGGESDGIGDNLQLISASISLLYQKADVRYSRFFNLGSNTLSLYCNTRWAEIKLENLDRGKRDITGPFTDSYDQASRFSGGGVGLGIGASRPLFCGFGIKGRAGIMGLIGRLKLLHNQYLSSREGNTLILDENGSTIIAPAWDMRLGIDYAIMTRCGFFSAEIGCQVDYYVGATRHNVWVGGAIEDDVVELNNFDAGFGGLYLQLSYHY